MDCLLDLDLPLANGPETPRSFVVNKSILDMSPSEDEVLRLICDKDSLIQHLNLDMGLSEDVVLRLIHEKDSLIQHLNKKRMEREQLIQRQAEDFKCRLKRSQRNYKERP